MKKDNWVNLSTAFDAAKPGVFALTLLVALAACGRNGGLPGNGPPTPPQTFAIGGTIGGLVGAGLVLQNNSGADLAVSTNGNFTFGTRLATGAAYSVSIKSQPANPDQICTVASGSGTIAASSITSVAVTCSATSFTIGGTVNGLTGTLVLQNNGANDLAISANGPFAFPGMLANGANYSVSVKTQPGNPPQVCAVDNASGTVAGANVGDIVVTCSEFLSVISTTPAQNASGVARDSTITIQFSAAIDAATVNDMSITLAAPSGSKKITLATAGSQVTVTPVGNLLPSTQYTLTITPAVRGTAGQALAAAVTRTFGARDGHWGTPRVIQSTTTLTGNSPQIGLDANGNAIAIWGQVDDGKFKLAANRYVAGLGWGAATIVDPDGHLTRNPKVAVAANGDAIAVWQDFTGTEDLILAARYAAGGVWNPEVLLGGSLGSEAYPQIDLDASGNGIAVWEEYDGIGRIVRARRYVVGADWEAGATPIATGSGTTSADGMAPQIALDEAGNAIATWRQKAGLFHDGWTRRYVAGSGWAPPTVIDSEQSSVSSVLIAVSPNGNAFAVWSQGTANFGHGSIWSNRYIAGSVWEQPVVLEKNDIAPAQAPALAINASGDAIAVWQHSDLSRTATDIWANRHAASTSWTGETLIETQNLGNANSAQVAMDPSGNAIAVWKQSDGTRTNIWTNRYVAGASWGVAQLLETADGFADGPQIAVDADGNAFAIWSQQQAPVGTAPYNIYVSRFE